MHWLLIAVPRLSLVAVSRGRPLLQCVGFSLRWLRLWRTGSGHLGLVVVMHGLAAPRRVGSSQTRDQSHVLCIRRQILNRWTAREALDTSLVNAFILMMLRSLALKKLKKIFLSFRFYGYKFVILFTTYRIFSFWSDC